MALLGAIGALGIPAMTSAAHADTVSDEAAFVNDINAARMAVGATPLVVDAQLTNLALYWAGQMATTNFLAHNPKLAQMGPPGWMILGENVGVGPSEQSLNSAFTASPHHYENMVDTRFSSIGIGEIVANGKLWVAEEFMGTTTPPALSTALVDGVAAAGPGGGYWLASSDGTVSAHNGAPYLGSVSGQPLARPVVGTAGLPSGAGYWLVGADGGIFTFGAAGYFGSTGSIHLNQPIVGMARTPSGLGYWLVASDGGIFAFGDAHFSGSTGSIRLNAPIVGMSPTSGQGYWLVGSDGGIFAFGDAAFFGSGGALALSHPISAMTATPSGNGYWLVESQGAVHPFGDAS